MAVLDCGRSDTSSPGAAPALSSCAIANRGVTATVDPEPAPSPSCSKRQQHQQQQEFFTSSSQELYGQKAVSQDSAGSRLVVRSPRMGRKVLGQQHRPFPQGPSHSSAPSTPAHSSASGSTTSAYTSHAPPPPPPPPLAPPAPSTPPVYENQIAMDKLSISSAGDPSPPVPKTQSPTNQSSCQVLPSDFCPRDFVGVEIKF